MLQCLFLNQSISRYLALITCIEKVCPCVNIANCGFINKIFLSNTCTFLTFTKRTQRVVVPTGAVNYNDIANNLQNSHGEVFFCTVCTTSLHTTVGPLLSAELDSPRFLVHLSTADNRGLTVLSISVEVPFRSVTCIQFAM